MGISRILVEIWIRNDFDFFDLVHFWTLEAKIAIFAPKSLSFGAKTRYITMVAGLPSTQHDRRDQTDASDSYLRSQ